MFKPIFKVRDWIQLYSKELFDKLTVQLEEYTEDAERNARESILTAIGCVLRENACISILSIFCRRSVMALWFFDNVWKSSFSTSIHSRSL